jgi:hypothetical protein
VKVINKKKLNNVKKISIKLFLYIKNLKFKSMSEEKNLSTLKPLNLKPLKIEIAVF